ncbi:hypothetical protein COT44_02880 [Candidatus Shapirobacteria bacterium CG08_land_8_20_14_0_20_39_18]|uniref:Nucleotidyl transferase AbiEii/AbiGii toxin family protein n=1 Tax=Candidatus Shapirobacteria bacterium CG08_land_8_20_14_0_20_39_18 TaxID=1974883 RepID=A0A2M6XD53_9BACT|nr:MAG: hypothetical protein COT44_02880 [Candidatus Shapirobacteria bacterium CG08_land_8_20_14_0_20_39_18]PIY65625.1 MAG: hypothetical protein COY91_01990 [Candidatus Shapirobacteria bacterium CG_4_10_14_0_8_um_filter_39_15]PJE68099.1 MAG: hypothetical protein COU94_03770 [Candidatus Shapirobacteria bacterium CG10_big_fil_rev_8_21_14_0_10_38_8]
MEKISTLTQEQKFILDGVAKIPFFRENFYFTGETALSEFHLRHRYSDDLDFFTEKKDNLDLQVINSLLADLGRQYDFTFSGRFIEVVYITMLTFSNGSQLKADFGYYPYQRLKKGIDHQGLAIDSLEDIAFNKLSTVSQRENIKDFVDLYFLLKEKHFTLWDLIYGLEVKFKTKVETLLLAEDLLKIEDFDTLPRMIKPLTFKELQIFFRKIAVELGKKAVE